MINQLRSLEESMSLKGSQSSGEFRSVGMAEPAARLDRDASRLALFCGLALLLVAASALLGAGSAGSARTPGAAIPDRNLRLPPPQPRLASTELAATIAEGSLLRSVVVLDGRGASGSSGPAHR
jgi:hypothetical protein